MVATAKTVNSLAGGARRLSKRLVASYILDWILILGIAAVGGAFSQIHGARHDFSLQDPSISYPYHDDTVTVGVLIVVVLVAPGVITAAISLLFIPGPTASPRTPRALIWRRKIWEWNTAWMGLGLSLASAFLITEGLKDLSGKPRPFMLSVCDPDTSPESIRRHQVGGLGSSLDSATPIVVSWHICRNTDQSQMRNAFASWPSGHSSFSWAGMLYLTFFLCAKFAVQIPFLPPATPPSNRDGGSRRFISTFDEEEDGGGVAGAGIHDQQSEAETTTTTTTAEDHGSGKKSLRSAGTPEWSSSLRQRQQHHHHFHPPRNEAAAPPIYLLIVAFVPVGVALFVCVSRWFDYRHHGFDIISGSLIGIFTAWFGFRWYHLPIRGGSGWSWGARSRDRAFWLGVGRANYVGDEGWESRNKIAAAQNHNHNHHDGNNDNNNIQQNGRTPRNVVDDDYDIEANAAQASQRANAHAATTTTNTNITGPGLPDHQDTTERVVS
ncbi:uncharacterized protein PV06_05327 [Exophiala oligosperma]|uniref:Phosphatidic acid phosphatase type 2/haloperoxidase domain-containing protein n=1 Tax=Exophiala oligosperma TaxID=215243 RepID=A0A0D2E8T9_9EURO|nr:uncharacterized protein PV06_05327 [Exophiala oligosperma]KIW44309.1 hypothetical protein PV06_05327 [Exophiala oligosperma]